MRKKPLAVLRAEVECTGLLLHANETATLRVCNDVSTVEYTVTPQSGYFEGHTYTFSINIPQNYPFSPPKAVCQMKILHPSIDSIGRVCLNITREDWSIEQGIQMVIFGLSAILYDVPTEDPLNKEAHRILMLGPEVFQRQAMEVYRSNAEKRPQQASRADSDCAGHMRIN
ncbi:ubiquitin-conjugating enzyme E2 M [Nematocida major]|uniref:ubiquitin-conjugating enzyme E2 M n=1 Tax=Nematocida major TaxID=1912982 RepID=UPI00200842FE|nr:ubiquitin-conjugating enzyme E2 M [Nematocida major]KAH9386807.1 ubiquitin-conjugating enzyme E2 M [Nematocida major]